MSEIIIGAKHRSALAELPLKDLQRLRVVARLKLLAAGCPPEHLSDKECDRWIESVLPQTAEKMVKRAVDRKLTP